MAGGGRIRGITIEIDGDTKGLTDALKKADGTIRNTQLQLKDINKLLKLDPTNITLLTQKHEYLDKAVNATKEKLDKERQALKQLKPEYDENGKITAQSAEKQRLLEREIIATEQSLNKLRSELTVSNPALQQFAQTSQIVADKTRRMSQIATAGLGALFANAYNSAKTADDLNTLARNTGFAVEELQKMQYASNLIDVSMDQMTGSIQKMTKQMGTGSKAFEELGVSIYDADGNLRDATDVWYETLEALSKIDNETERDAKSMEIFGKSAMEMSGIIDDGGEALKSLGQEAEDAGLILSGDALESANEFNDAIDKMKATLQQGLLKSGATLATALVPALERIVTAVTNAVTWFANLDAGTQKLMLTLLAIVASISPLATMFASITTVISGISTAIAFFGTTAGATILLIGALITAGVMLYTHWDELVAYATKVKDNLVAEFTYLKDGIVGAFNTITAWAQALPANIANGILSQIELVKSSAEQIGQGMLDKLSAFFDQMHQVGSDLISKVKDGVSEAFNGALEFFSGIGSSIVDGIWSGISGAIGSFTENVRGFFSNIVDSVKGELGIHSPSRVFAYIGEMMGEGIEVGWDEALKGFHPNADLLATVPNLGKGMQYASAYGGKQYSFTNNITLNNGRYSERDGMNIALSIDRWLGERI